MTRRDPSDERSGETATLLVTCPDRTGLVAALAQTLYGHGANILDADQHTDAHTDTDAHADQHADGNSNEYADMDTNCNRDATHGYTDAVHRSDCATDTLWRPIRPRRAGER